MNKIKVNKIKRHTLISLIAVVLYYAYSYYTDGKISSVKELMLWTMDSAAPDAVTVALPIQISNLWNILFFPLAFATFWVGKYSFYNPKDEEKLSEENRSDLYTTLLSGASIAVFIIFFGIIGCFASMVFFIPLFTIVFEFVDKDNKEVKLFPKIEIRPNLKYIYVFIIGCVTLCAAFYNFVVAIPLSIFVILIGLIIFAILFPISSFIAFYVKKAIVKTSNAIGDWYAGK